MTKIKEVDEYWQCLIGPCKRSDMARGADAPMRWAVEKAFTKVTGKEPETISSGWGYDNTGAPLEYKKLFPKEVT